MLLHLLSSGEDYFTRSRAYKKNDSCHVEQKNGNVVRRLVGYDRYTTKAAYQCLKRLYASLRLSRQKQRLEIDITGRKKQILRIIDSYLPGVRKPFLNLWSSHGREFLRTCLNSLAVVRDGDKALNRFLS